MMDKFDDFPLRKEDQEKLRFLGPEYKLNPNALEFVQKGQNKFRWHSYKTAFGDFGHAIKCMPDNPNLYAMRGIASYYWQSFPRENDFIKTLQMIPNHLLAAYYMGLISYNKSDYDGSSKWLQIAYDNFPRCGLGNYGMTKRHIFFISQRYILVNIDIVSGIIENQKKGIKYPPDRKVISHQDLLLTGNRLYEQGRHAEAIPILEGAVRLGSTMAVELLDRLKEWQDFVEKSKKIKSKTEGNNE